MEVTTYNTIRTNHYAVREAETSVSSQAVETQKINPVSSAELGTQSSLKEKEQDFFSKSKEDMNGAAVKMAEKYREKSDQMAKMAALKKAKKKNNGRLNSITRKMRRGDRLSKSELGYLSQESPGLYRKAITAERKREQLEQDLKRCKTKEEVRRLRVRVTSAVMGSTSLDAAAVAVGGVNVTSAGSSGGVNSASGISAGVAGMDAGMADMAVSAVQASMSGVSSAAQEQVAASRAIRDAALEMEFAAISENIGVTSPGTMEAVPEMNVPGAAVTAENGVTYDANGNPASSDRQEPQERLHGENPVYRSMDQAYRRFKMSRKYREMPWTKKRYHFHVKT